MDLGGWNTDFDPNLLGEWTEGVDTSNRTSSIKDDNGEDDDPLTSALPAFTDDDGGISERSLGVHSDKPEESSALTPTAPRHKESDFNTAMAMSEHAAAISETTSVTSNRDERSRSSGGSSNSTNTANSNQVNHPLAISSSASCPPPGSATIGGAPGPAGIIHPPSTSSDLYSVDLSQALEKSNIGAFAPMNSGTTGPAVTAMPPQAATNPHLSMLANNFLLAASASLQPHALQQVAAQHHHPHSHQHQQHAAKPGTDTFPVPGKPAGNSQQQGSSTTGSSTTAASLPPFYLFDAPIELRANFMANQRKLGLPIEHDPNSFYYGETVNGYHPQQLLKASMNNQHTAASLLQVGLADPTKLHPHRHHNPPPKMIDARHGSNRRSSKGGQQKNEREQKRAQKITELIEQLRAQIEESGWQVEGRSKFNTLSKCAEYVKHMIKSTTEKEEEVEKLKNDLEMKKRKAEEKAAQDSRSDPESVTSSLTSDTTRSRSSGNSSSGDNQSTVCDDKKRKPKDDDVDNESSSENSGMKHKKPRRGEAATEESSGEGKSGTGSGSGGSGSGNGKSAQGYSIGKTVSTVSDLTDSNRGSSCNNSGSATDSGETNEVPEREGGENPSSSSISSDAAVASEKTSRGRHSGHKDVVFNNDKRSRKRPPSEVTSLERNFELDYKEVFDMSNIPQLIATTSGKIITWNECFVKATGYRKSEIERLTIFSLVRPDKLSNFFDIVAAALRPHEENESITGVKEEGEPRAESVSTDPTETEKSDKAGDESKETVKSEDADSKQAALPVRLMDYKTITLPCVDFPAMKKRNQAISDSDSLIDPLTVTATLMGDKDVRKRCFHCVFTNCRGTDGALGSITPELLASLFSAPIRRRKKQSQSERKHKRMRMADDQEDDDDDDEFEKPPPRPPKSIGGPATTAEESNQGDTCTDRDEPN